MFAREWRCVEADEPLGGAGVRGPSKLWRALSAPASPADDGSGVVALVDSRGYGRLVDLRTCSADEPLDGETFGDGLGDAPGQMQTPTGAALATRPASLCSTKESRRDCRRRA